MTTLGSSVHVSSKILGLLTSHTKASSSFALHHVKTILLFDTQLSLCVVMSRGLRQTAA